MKTDFIIRMLFLTGLLSVALISLISDTAYGESADLSKGAELNGSAPTQSPATYLLAVGKSKVIDPPQQQQRAIDAVRLVASSARSYLPSINMETMSEEIMSRNQFLNGEYEIKVNGSIFRKKLKELAKKSNTNDTVIIYTHTHGTKPRAEASSIKSGLIFDPGPKHLGGESPLTWSEYAELLLEIPARNVIVLTMACYSGALIEHLNSDPLKKRWNTRQQNQNRNFIVITSQNSNLMSMPIVRNQKLINPFTLAVAEALSGQADGFNPDGLKIDNNVRKDNRLTAGEITDYIMCKTRSIVSEAPQRVNNADPQITGCFDRSAVLLENSP